MGLGRSPPSTGVRGTPTTLLKRPAGDLIEDSPPRDTANAPKKPNVHESVLTLTSTEADTMSPKKKGPNSQEKNKPNQTDNFSFNVPTHNKFSVLNNKVFYDEASKSDNKSADADNRFNKKKNKLPPITIVGAMNFSNAIKIVNNVAKDNYYMKYMSIGVKFHISSAEHYNLIKERLLNERIEFYTHDIDPERFEKYIVSGISKTDSKALDAELKELGFNVASVNEIEIKNPRFPDEGLYRVMFRGPVDSAKLNRTRLNHTVVKWKKIVSGNKLTQCRRCQNFGHGSRNCNVTFKCGKCGGLHETTTCSSETLKCANCNGDHHANDPDCPKRKSFVEMRKKMSAKNNPSRVKRQTVPPRLDSPLNFPRLPSKKSQSLYSSNEGSSNCIPGQQWPFVNRTTFNNLGRPDNGPTKIPAKGSTQDQHESESSADIFNFQELKMIFSTVLQGLKKCKTKEEQLQLMFDLAAQYIYGNP